MRPRRIASSRRSWAMPWSRGASSSSGTQNTPRSTPEVATTRVRTVHELDYRNDTLDVSVVVPVYDEEASLPALADQIRTVCDEEGYRFEVHFIDDGSRDGSWEVIRRIHEADPRFSGIRFRRNYGKSAALAVGFEHARGRYIVTM